jgi:hypothetical protein
MFYSFAKKMFNAECLVGKEKSQYLNWAAAGSDNIPAELIKQGGIELKRRIHNLIKNVWKEETVRTERTERIICPIYIRKEIE